MNLVFETGKVQTRDGREVRIYATDGHGDHPIHGAIKTKLGWVFAKWTSPGDYYGPSTMADNDLVPMRQRIQRKHWVNVYSEGQVYPFLAYQSRRDADLSAGTTRLACIEMEIDCFEGDGL